MSQRRRQERLAYTLWRDSLPPAERAKVPPWHDDGGKVLSNRGERDAAEDADALMAADQSADLRNGLLEGLSRAHHWCEESKKACALRLAVLMSVLGTGENPNAIAARYDRDLSHIYALQRTVKKMLREG